MTPASLRLHSGISLQKLRFQVKLGWEPGERATLQFVCFDLKLRFDHLPQGCQTDELADTVCYGELSLVLEKLCRTKEYRLIEKLGMDAFKALKKRVGPDVRLWVRVTKEKPPIPTLEEGASFAIGEWEEI